MTATFPWRELMAFGLGQLKLAPRDFWAMTPKEIAAAIEGLAGIRPAPPARATLDDLMTRYPDR
jgi:uncharacterized phage protein (TIGR02216 family)